MEEKISIKSGEILLEGLFDPSGINGKGVIITHPHPLYGGNMYNNVVETLVSVFKDRGYSTLRFNFRGAGSSQGHHTENGEGEMQDVAAAAAFIVEKGLSPVFLAGYSYGSWVSHSATCRGFLASFPLEGMLMVSPPVDFIGFDRKSINLELRIISGGYDNLGRPFSVKKVMNDLARTVYFESVEDADHFWVGHEDDLYEKVLAAIS